MLSLGRMLDPNNLRPLFDAYLATADFVEMVREDVGFLARARRAILKLPREQEPVLPEHRFPAAEPLEVPMLRQQRVAVVASGGSGALSSMIGVQRAFEEAGVRPVALSAASAGVLFTLPWAFGLRAEAVARFWMELPQRGYLDPDWRAFFRAFGHSFGGWAGLLRGEAVERSFRSLLGDARLGDARVPFSTVVWNIDLNRVETIGTLETPALPAALAARVAIAIPIFVEPVRVGAHLYGDGGVIDIFPVRPVLAQRPDLVLGVNGYLPDGFAGDDVSGWRSRKFAILRASGQLRWSGMLALAREQARLAGDRLSLLHPVPHEQVRGARFYDLFVDRARWPAFMDAGRERARQALRRMEANAQASALRAAPEARA